MGKEAGDQVPYLASDLAHDTQCYRILARCRVDGRIGAAGSGIVND